jgi:hypothetical protein
MGAPDGVLPGIGAKKRADPMDQPYESFWERMPERPDPYDPRKVLLQMRKNWA